MEISATNIIGELVAQDYRTASVFKTFGIDFCCKGNRSIQEVCEKNHIKTGDLIDQLKRAAKKTEVGTPDFQSWPLDLLADYIEKTHHRYVVSKIMEIQPYLEKVCMVHGKNHLELYEIKDLFYQGAAALTSHMKKEESILFPLIRQMAGHHPENQDDNPAKTDFVQPPIAVMMEEHDTEGARFRQIASLSNRYTPPEEACNTYRVVFAMLREFEENLHLHIHLENNILFPKAIAVEKNLKYAGTH